MADTVSKGDYIVPKLEIDTIVWVVDEEPDKHGHVWGIRTERRLGAGYQVGRRFHVSKVYVVDVRETFYDWPHVRWNPDKAKAQAPKIESEKS